MAQYTCLSFLLLGLITYVIIHSTYYIILLYHFSCVTISLVFAAAEDFRSLCRAQTSRLKMAAAESSKESTHAHHSGSIFLFYLFIYYLLFILFFNLFFCPRFSRAVTVTIDKRS